VVLTEVELSDMDGLRLGRAMRQDPALHGVPVILLSAGEHRPPTDAVTAAPFAGFLPKPPQQAQLYAAVVSALEAGKKAAETRVAVRHEEAEAEVAVSRTGALILLVEDNPNNQLVAMRQVEKLGHDVHVVSSGVQAVKSLAYGSKYDVVLMDCQMPEMDGYTATREIRKSEVVSGRHIPIIAMTANAMSGDREACLAAGMDDYISKPVTRTVLAETLSRWLMPHGAGVADNVA
jgi:CheY-like chemotaxis protein